MGLDQNQRVVVVTGGSRGIGRAVCLALAGVGTHVYFNYSCSSSQALETEALVVEKGGRATAVGADVTAEDDVRRFFAAVIEESGRLDVLVNNAGITVNNTILGMTIDEFDTQRSVMRGAWYLTKKILRLFMLRQSGGRIINISSITGHMGNPGQIPYTMEKGALDAMTKSLAKEFSGRNILVNSVAPGFIDTDMTRDLPEEIKTRMIRDVPLQRMGLPEEVAEVVAFLASQGSYINGTVIHVNGGNYGG